MDEVLSQEALKEIDALLEVEPESGPAAPGPDIPALRENLAVLVSSGRAKEAIGTQLTHEQVKRLSDKDVEKLAKRYETWVGSKTTDCFIDGCIFLATNLVEMGVKIKDIKAYQKELKEDYILNNELSIIAGKLSLNYGRCLAVANAALITAKHIDFSSTNAPEQSTNAPEQSTNAPEQSPRGE